MQEASLGLVRIPGGGQGFRSTAAAGSPSHAYNAQTMISTSAFRDVLRHFASGVTLVTARDGERVYGLTVSAFSSLSADPPLIAVVIDQRSSIHQALAQEGAGFAVNILAEDHRELSDRFAFVPDADRFAEGVWGATEDGIPVLEDALAWLACTVEASHPVGSHVLYIGRVRASHTPRAEHPPLVYWNREYRKLGG
ncbi:MAG: flavin reductase family protein [Acidobacteria bacterium]|nr:flavin reductase family protein [Acidobacteriota bacterium]